MNLADRLAAYEKIELHRRRPLIVYVTSTRENVRGMMAADAVRVFADQIDAIRRLPAFAEAGGEPKSVDVLIHSTGGDALAAWKLMSILRERFKTVSVLVPYMAFSAATIFALGADEIFMHPYASLGPIDPQITVTRQDGTRRRFSFEDVGAFLRFLESEVAITEQAHKSAVIDKLFTAVDPLIVGAAKRASELATAVGERLLATHMTSAEERLRATEIARNLNKSFYSHGDALSRSQARKQQLRIAKDDPILEGLIWSAYLLLEDYMELRSPFNPLQHYLANQNAREQIRPKAPVVLPANTPPALAENIWKAVAKKAIEDLEKPQLEVEYRLVNAVVESRSLASECITEGAVTAARAGGGEIHVAVTDHQAGWRSVDLPVPEQVQPGERPADNGV